MNNSHIALPILLSIAEISGLLIIGGMSRYYRYIDERDITRWSKFVLDILYPAFIFSTITRGFDHNRIHEVWMLPLIGFGIGIVGFIFGLALKYGLYSKDPDIVRTFLYGCMVNNYGFLPIVIVSNLWGTGMVANLFFLTLGSTIIQWTLGVSVLGAGDAKTVIKNLFSPTLLAIIAGMLVSLTGVEHYIPSMIEKIIISAGSAAVPLMLILSGAALFNPAAWNVTWQVLYLTIVRLIILPLLVIVGLRLLHLPQDVYVLSVLIALMPLAVSQTIFIRIFGGHPEYAACSSLISTIGSIITIPLALWLLLGTV
jgi:malate permease and related proteins